MNNVFSRSFYRQLLRELSLLLGGWRIVMNITLWGSCRELALPLRVNMVYLGSSCSFSL